MRKIEKEMVAALVRREGLHKANMMVTTPDDSGKAEVFLHGNHIANVWREADGLRVEPNRYTFRQWPTVTTRSRLCALGVHANIKNGAACIDGVPA